MAHKFSLLCVNKMIKTKKTTGKWGKREGCVHVLLGAGKIPRSIVKIVDANNEVNNNELRLPSNEHYTHTHTLTETSVLPSSSRTCSARS